MNNYLLLLCVFLPHKIVYSADTYPQAKYATREGDVLQHELVVQGRYIDISVEMIKSFKCSFMFLISLIMFKIFFVFVIYILLKSLAVPSSLIPISCFDCIESLD
jgi:hypothetical protein